MMYFSLVFFFKIFLSVMPLFCWVIIYLTCIVIHHTQPMSVGIHHAKGFWDMLIYKTYTRCLKSYTNFWTPCSLYKAHLSTGMCLCDPFTGRSLSEKIHVYIYFLGNFRNMASLGSRMYGKWKLHGERPALTRISNVKLKLDSPLDLGGSKRMRICKT